MYVYVCLEIIVAVFRSVLNDVKSVLEELHQVAVRIDYFVVDDDVDADDTGTADTLRMMHDKIKVSFIDKHRQILAQSVTYRFEYSHFY